MQCTLQWLFFFGSRVGWGCLPAPQVSSLEWPLTSRALYLELHLAKPRWRTGGGRPQGLGLSDYVDQVYTCKAFWKKKSSRAAWGSISDWFFFKFLLCVRALRSAQVKKPSLLQERDNSCVLCYRKRNLMEWVMVFSTESKPWPVVDRIHLLLT